MPELIVVGSNVGFTVGAFEGDELGLGVGWPSRKVGVAEGAIEGALVGAVLGKGVGAFARYVGAIVG